MALINHLEGRVLWRVQGAIANVDGEKAVQPKVSMHVAVPKNSCAYLDPSSTLDTP